jgi:hypothetical protein
VVARVIVVAVLVLLPAASSAVTVITLEPVNSWMVAADHAASVVEPSIAAVPEPPRSFDHLTRYRRMLSEARPARPTTLVVGALNGGVIDTLGAIESMRRQRIRSASSIVSPAALSPVATVSDAAPPQPIRVSAAVAWTAASNKTLSLSFMWSIPDRLFEFVPADEASDPTSATGVPGGLEAME